MALNDRLAPGMLEATQLTRAGRLLEATAAIQRALGRQPAAKAAHRPLTAKIPERRAGDFIAGSYSHPHGARPYKLYVPTGYSAGKALPLVVMLHGCAQNPDDFAAGTRMNVLGEERQCFVLYPAQTKSANPSRCWNWFKRSNQHRDKGEPAIIAGMTREVAKRYGIDGRKIYAAGLSAGGAMAAVMGATYPELFAAVGIHSGLPVGSAHDLPSAFAAMRGTRPAHASGAAREIVPAIVFHGDRDATVHPSNGEQVASQCVDRDDRSIDVVVQRGQVPGGHAYTCTVHRDAAGRVLLEHWEVHGAGHAWSGGSASGSYTDPSGPDAAREMMRFFGL
jgi:poly(hydroxyalkanoate) depolymerase family esterase